MDGIPTVHVRPTCTPRAQLTSVAESIQLVTHTIARTVHEDVALERHLVQLHLNAVVMSYCQLVHVSRPLLEQRLLPPARVLTWVRVMLVRMVQHVHAHPGIPAACASGVHVTRIRASMDNAKIHRR